MSVLRGGYYYSGGADYAIADAVAGLDHGINRFLFGIRVRLVQDRVMLGGVEVLALFAELLDAELLEGLVNLGGDGLERVVHLAVFANAVDIVEGGQQRGQHVDDAVLAALDDIDRIREHSEMDESFKAVSTKIDNAFEKFGVEKFGEKGEDFDPTKHDAILHKPDPQAEKETVDTVVEAGYRIGDRVIRAARVVVASPQN